MKDPETTTSWRLDRRPDGRLDLVDAAGSVHADVDVLRAFPLSDPEGAVAIVGADGAELAWIEQRSSLPAAERRLVEAELAVRDFLPVIESVESVTEGEPTHWQVKTDRGMRQFTTANADAIDRRRDGSIVITDTHGIRFLIRDRSGIDARSRRLIDKCS
jgi:hypothetical protein